MKLGLLIYGLDRMLTGIGRYTYELVRAFAELESQVRFTLLAAGGLGPLAGSHPLQVVRLPASRLLPGLMTVGNFSVLSIGRKLGLDLVHDLTGSAPLLFAARGFPVISTIHDVFPLSIPGYSSRLDTLIYRHWLPRMTPKLGAIITVSDQSRRDIHQYFKISHNNIHVIPEGVSEMFKPIPQEAVRQVLREKYGLEQEYILYVGALTQRKNIVRLMEGYAEVRASHPEMALVITGPDSWVQTPVEATITRLNLQDQVILTGPVTDEDLVYLYNGARLFAFPSLYEGFGLPVLEAMACGTPVVTSNLSSLPEVAGEAALLVDPYDVGAIAAAMHRILEDPALANDLREKGLKRAAQFTWERTARETIAVYEKVLGMHKTDSP